MIFTMKGNNNSEHSLKSHVGSRSFLQDLLGADEISFLISVSFVGGEEDKVKEQAFLK